MKKSCALALAGLYLVIITSVYTCLLHCTSKYLPSALRIVQQLHQSDKDHERSEQTHNDTSTDNPKVAYIHVNASTFNFRFTTIQVGLLQLKKQWFYIPKYTEDLARWTPANGPPV